MKLNASLLLLTMALALPAITACTSHTHAAAEYDRDPNGHWQICDCGESLSEPEAHTLDEESICTVCKNTVDVYEDGSVYIYNHNEYGEIPRTTYFAADGSMLSDERSEFALDAEGDPYTTYTYVMNYELNMEYECTYNEHGDILTRVMTDRSAGTTDNDRWEREYNADGQIMWEKQYRNDVLVSEISDYKQSESADYSVRYPEKMIDYYDDGTKFVTINGEWGMPVSETTYAADGSVITETTYVWEFDDAANTLDKQVFTDGVLVLDEDYAYDEYGYTYVSKQTEYREDGTSCVTEYYADGNSNYVVYSADGAVIEES